MFYSRFCYVCMYVSNANDDGRNGQTTQAGAAVAKALNR